MTQPDRLYTRYGYPDNYTIHGTGLFFYNNATYQRREIPYSFHSNPMCSSAAITGTLDNTTTVEVTIFEDVDLGTLFYVKPTDGLRVNVTQCGTCTNSKFALLRRPGDWPDLGSCRDQPLDVFFPEAEGIGAPSYAQAKAICYDCPVRQECLEYALDTRTEYGMWGGATPSQRLRMLRDRNES